MAPPTHPELKMTDDEFEGLARILESRLGIALVADPWFDGYVAFGKAKGPFSGVCVYFGRPELLQAMRRPGCSYGENVELLVHQIVSKLDLAWHSKGGRSDV